MVPNHTRRFIPATLLALSTLAAPAPAPAQIFGQIGEVIGEAASSVRAAGVRELPEGPATYVLSFEVDGNISSAADGRFILDGALWMREERDGDRVRLKSTGVKDQFWRYTMEDPPNLFGDNSKRRFASVLILDDHRNRTWNEATRPMREFGNRISQRYYPGKTLHTNKHFYILGSARDRFQIRVDADGAVGEVKNLLTRNADGRDSYNSLGWDYWAGYEKEDGRALSDARRARRWGIAADRSHYGPGDRSGSSSWYPNTFVALAQSLTFFEKSPYRGGAPGAIRDGARWTQRWAEFPRLFETLLVTFEDEASQLDYTVDTPSMTYRARVRDGRLTVTGSTGQRKWKGSWSIVSLSGTYSVGRVVEYDLESSRVIRDEITFSVKDNDWKANMECEMKVGFRVHVPPRS